MLTHSLHTKLEKLFSQFGNPDDHFNIIELQGFMYAIAITPDILQPSEWLPKIFNDQMPEFESIEQTQAVMNTMLNVYNHYNDLRIKGVLEFPYDLAQLNEELFDVIMDWSGGFLTGLRLRMDIWMRRIIADELGVDEDPVANSVAVVKALADDSFDTTPMIKKIKDDYPGEVSEEELEQRLVAHLLTILPEAVKILQDFSQTMDERRVNEQTLQKPAHSRKIGRNEPCPCGSGKKYKKCCGQHGQDGLIH